MQTDELKPPKIEIRVAGHLVYEMSVDQMLMVQAYTRGLDLPAEYVTCEMKVMQGRNTQAFIFKMPKRLEFDDG